MDQKVADQIRSRTPRFRAMVNRTGALNASALLLDEIEKAFLGERTIDDFMVNQIKADPSFEIAYYLAECFTASAWPIENPVVKKLIRFENYNLSAANLSGSSSMGPSLAIGYYIANQLTNNVHLETRKFIEFLYAQGFSDEMIISITIKRASPFNNDSHRSQNSKGTAGSAAPFSEYLKPLLRPSKGFLGLAKKEGVKELVDKAVFADRKNQETISGWLEFLYRNYPEGLENDFERFLFFSNHNGHDAVLVRSVFFLIQEDAERFASMILDAMKKAPISLGERFSVLVLLNEKLDNRFQNEIVATGEAHLKFFEGKNHSGSYYQEPVTPHGRLSEAYTDYLYKKDPVAAVKRIDHFFDEAVFLNYEFFNYIDGKFGEDSIPILIKALTKEPKNLPTYNAQDYYTTLFAILAKGNLDPYFDQMVDFAVHRAGKTTRPEIAKLIVKDPERALVKAQELLGGKTTDLRVTGTFILFFLRSDRAASILNEAVENETNDDTRDIMLEALSRSRFAKHYSVAQVKEMITSAAARKKLSKWNEKWIVEEQLPTTYWINGGGALDQEAVRFLFYRMKRAIGLNSDIEARQLLINIDREASQEFSKALLVAFENSNSDIKVKFYLTIAGLLGNDAMMHRLNLLFSKCITDKRMKMAEYVIGALAMIGTSKALRLVEAIYRKYAARKPGISRTAREALDAAATELGISMDELSDRIVPDFGFEGNYKKFVIDGDEYRAFVNADFKLNYFTEDNKIKKSLPANASKELKAEFKEIEKEIKEVIKSQSLRLEKYMIEERRWSAEDWRHFFFENPVLFVYALKLVWGVYDEYGKLVNTFYCSEDASLYDLNDEETELQENQYIGILHPIALTEEQRRAWQEKLYALKITTIFPILERLIFRVEESEREATTVTRFNLANVPKGADFVNTFLVKQQWLKTSGDGGSSEFYKLFKDGVIKAAPVIDGPTAYYQGGDATATVHDIIFHGRNWNDLLKLKDIPPVFFSEVLADISQLINSK